MIVDVDGILVSSDIFTVHFCCDLRECHGLCCVEGEAGAPVTLEEIDRLEEVAELVWDRLSPAARQVIERQGVAYADREGDMVTSIVEGEHGGEGECVFACREDGCWRCSVEQAKEEGLTGWDKPMSCALYPLREKHLKNGTIGLNYQHWDICQAARHRGDLLHLPLYKFLRIPLIRRFGSDWYSHLEEVATAFYSHFPHSNFH